MDREREGGRERDGERGMEREGWRERGGRERDGERGMEREGREREGNGDGIKISKQNWVLLLVFKKVTE